MDISGLDGGQKSNLIIRLILEKLTVLLTFYMRLKLLIGPLERTKK